jgi:putative Mn2+ efflux pump MntP
MSDPHDRDSLGDKVASGFGVGAGMLGCLVYLGLGLLQLAAIMAQLESFLGWPWFVAGPVGIFLTYIPLVGSVVGFFGAKDVFGWEWWQAGLLFFGIGLLSVIMAFASSSGNRRY